MKTIVVPVDFSSASLNAANYALELSRRVGASITLVYVCQLPVAVSEAPVAAATIQGIIDDAQREIRELKDKLLRAAGGKLTIYTEVKEGYVTSQLAQLCEKLSPYALVMGAGDASVVERIVFGSNTLAAMKHLKWPLIIVPGRVKYKDIVNIGFACDLRDVIRTVHAADIKKLVTDLGARLHIIHINSGNGKPITDEEIEGSEWVRDLFGGLNPGFHFLQNQNIEVALNDFAENNNLDMLIVVPKKHGVLEDLFHRSQSKQVALRTHIPLLSIHE